MRLRPYQEEAIGSLRSDWTAGGRRPAVVLPTGLGKTVIFSELVRRWTVQTLGIATNGRAMILVHRDELVSQTVDKLRQLSPGLRVGVIKAERNELEAEVYVASVQTLSREGRLIQLDPWRVGLIVVDECHHAAADSYLRILQYFGCFSGQCLAVGFTATMERSDTRLLGQVWERVVYTKDILWGMNPPEGEGGPYLRGARGRLLTIDGLDLASVARSSGDFQDGSLGDALEQAHAGEQVAKAWIENAPDRQGILFAPNVRSTEYLASELNAAGIATAVITGATPRDERMEIFRRTRAGDIQVLANCMVLTEGFDMPQLSCAAIVRPTMKAGLYVQMAGRVLRPWPGTPDEALILDFSGVSTRHRLATIADLTSEEVTPEDGESLAEALERTLEQQEKAGKGKGKSKPRRLSGALQAEDVDLFHLSHSAWLQTHGGRWFIPAKGRTWLLWPDGESESGRELFRVGFYEGYSTCGGVWTHQGLELELAMAAAEEAAAAFDPSVTMRGAAWRRAKAEVGSPQWNLAVRYGMELDPAQRYRKGEISDFISVHLASRVLDRKGK